MDSSGGRGVGSAATSSTPVLAGAAAAPGTAWGRPRLERSKRNEENGLGGRIECKGFWGKGELKVVKRAVHRLVGEAGVGNRLQHRETVGEEGFGSVGLLVCVDLESISVAELWLGSIAAGDVAISGGDDGWPLLAERAEAGIGDEIFSRELLRRARSACFCGLL